MLSFRLKKAKTGSQKAEGPFLLYLQRRRAPRIDRCEGELFFADRMSHPER